MSRKYSSFPVRIPAIIPLSEALKTDRSRRRGESGIYGKQEMSLDPVSSDQIGSPGQASPALHGAIGNGLGDDAIALPCEHVLLARVKLPSVPRRQLEAAVRLAIRDLIAEPLDRVHIVPGPDLGQGDFLVAVVRHAVMEEWAPRADAEHARLVPDVFALPVPPAGSLFVREARRRVLARLADGTGFATRTEAFPTFWRAGGMPRIVLFGGQLPQDLRVGEMRSMPSAPPPEALTFDLMTDRHARERRLRHALMRVAAVVVLALIGHGVILGAETAALGNIAARQEALVRDELAARAAVAQLPLPDAGSPRPANAQPVGGGFLPLLAQVSDALPSLGDGIVVRNMTFDADAGSLGILVEGPDLAALQGIESRLGAAGLNVSSGTATSGDGAAKVRLVIGRAINEQ